MNALPILNDDFQKQILQGVFRRAWRMSGFGLMGFVYTWLLGLWVLQIFVHPGFVMGFGILYALVLGLWMGSSTQQDEGEEMLFSLPPTRSQLYWVQAAVGGLPLLLLCVIGVVALRVEAPQSLWGLFVTSGFTESFPLNDVQVLWSWSVGLPMLLFAGVYGFTAQTVNRSGTLLALILGGVMTAAVTLGGWALELVLFETPPGGLSGSLMLAVAALILWGCGHRYQQKEGHPGPATTKAGPGGKVALISVIVLIVFVILGFFMISFRVTRSSEMMETREAELRSKEAEFRTRRATAEPLSDSHPSEGE